LTRPRLLLVAAGAIVVLAVGPAVSSARRPPSPGRAVALAWTDPADGAAPVRAAGGVDLSFAAAEADAAGSAEVANGAAHPHGVDPVSAALLAIDGVVALAVVVLLLRRRPPPPS
jgi:hypothetical protein